MHTIEVETVVVSGNVNYVLYFSIDAGPKELPWTHDATWSKSEHCRSTGIPDEAMKVL